MTRSKPSLLMLALLQFVESRNEALAGDLVEEWCRGRSRQWFWYQLLRAALISFRQEHVAQARTMVGLATAAPVKLPDLTLGLIDPATMSLSGIKVRSIGGLGLLVALLLVVIVLPAAGLLVLTGLVGGAVLAIGLVKRRQDRGLSGPADKAPLTLFGETADVLRCPSSTDHRHPGFERLSIVKG